MTAPTLIACRDCDLLQRETALPAGGAARCGRCGAVLYRKMPESLDRTLAFTLAAGVLFLLANAFPLVGLEVQGQRNATDLLGAVRALWDQDMRMVAGLVFLTTVLIPAIELSGMIYLLLPLRLGRLPSGTGPMLRFLQAVKPWGMVEVFMLGVLVSLVKLAHLASIVPGIALWSFGGLILLLAASAASFNPHEVWARVRV
ncbi:MAG: paraquat-inducible protein A [Gammaproteobacteria bacterium]